MGNNSFYFIVVLVAALVVWRRTRSMYRPIKGNGRRLLLPIFFFIPGLALISSPEVHLRLWEDLLAVTAGLLLSTPLIWTTEFEIREDRNIYAKKNMAFVFAFLGVFVIRIVMRSYFTSLDSQSVAALFMIVAISYIVPWRVISYMKFRKVYLSNTKRSIGLG
ncbi:cytochrome c biogenesis protein CcdC [Halobacillus salinarum]|uniref:Cytochrome c biogenesis protein CcdC n=1 Tax=Halobacillus salinarum TaxID=2932257 RepID=A0ABY4EP71_9BACI|nr:cytochrome c biogenesis protein CcdC [Halobacillus salinarum]UOQ45886.1 cytochrome c biogenesis protein CcdC [Halobacillus salinarum]